MDKKDKILIYACGNPSRQDDGLGILFCNYIDEWANEEQFGFIETDSNYQFNIEDSNNIREYGMIIFVDASFEDVSTYKMESIEPDNKTDFTMHHITPQFVLYLSEKLFSAKPRAYLLHLKGYDWKLDEEMTEEAKKNLETAVKDVTLWLKKLHDDSKKSNNKKINFHQWVYPT